MLSFNLLIFVGTFLMQWGIGLVIDLSTCPIPLKEAPFPLTLVIVVDVPGFKDMINYVLKLVRLHLLG